MDVWELSWAGGRLEVQSLGGMLGAVDFRLPSGDTVSPLHTPEWTGDPRAADLPPVVRHLRGEWACVPFGAAREVPGLSQEWREVVENSGDPSMASGFQAAAGPEAASSRESASGATAASGPQSASSSQTAPDAQVASGSRAASDPPHGHGANEHWDLVDRSDAGITIAIGYPEGHPVRRLRRTIRPRSDEPAVDIELEIEARADVRLPVGVHPVLRLAADARGTHLRPAAFRFGMTFPGDFEPAAYPLEPGEEFGSLASVPAADGGTIDISRLPLQRDAEAFVQLCGVDGTFELYHEREDYHVRVEWDAKRFPSCGLWISNRGRTGYPWNGRHVALGVEPIASAFDLGPAVATADNPISRRGVATFAALGPDRAWNTKYSLTVHR